MTGPTSPQNSGSSWTLRQSRAQYTAVAWLRWRVFVNSFRRKGSTADLIAILVAAPIFGLIALAVAGVTGYSAYAFTSDFELNRIAWLLWGTFILCQLLNINIGQPGTVFDPTQLIRFPLRARNYIILRLFFGILSPANVMVAILSLAIAIGMTVAEPWLWAYAFVAMAVFAITNAIFTRMVFAWIDRWLATRRAREVFTAIIFTLSLVGQWVNVRFNPAYNHHHVQHGRIITQQRFNAMSHAYQHVKPLVNFLPPGLTGDAMISAAAHRPVWYLGYVVGCGVFGFFFFAVFAMRTRTEFRGEVFSDVANAVSLPVKMAHSSTAAREPATRFDSPAEIASTNALFSDHGKGALRLSPVVLAVFGKELLAIRRNTGVFYALIAPVVMVFLFAGRLATRSSPNSIYIFPASLAYALVGIVPLAFNSFGLEGPGAQFYFLAPVRLRDIFLAKNLVNFLLAYAETAAVLAIVTYLTGLPTLNILVSSLLWAVGTLLITTTIGNRRSVTAPKKIDPGRTSSKQASPASAFLGMGLLLLLAGFGMGILTLARHFDMLAVLPLAMLVFMLASASIYVTSLRSVGRFTLAHRDELFEELCKEASSSVRR
ncbi:ABC-2 type transport system permease protein [Bryocella elongata]|uniref:ABC-2 type transport system permease protein n=1 Tax=Bryocella elongata TaxID=863522 RepID=A0A1H6C8Z5_9BACT|nr:hypothetical protein [Bryocella elongata]SEG69431.1 ABC-2 type transport system permease protein [Bryocella elongata]